MRTHHGIRYGIRDVEIRMDHLVSHDEELIVETVKVHEFHTLYLSCFHRGVKRVVEVE